MNQLLQGYLNPVKVIKNKAGLISWDTPFRCLPFDMDLFLHMNNAMYLRVAELARWRIFVQASSSSSKSATGALFLVVENKVQYLKPIDGFKPFVINTSLSSTEDKWLHYKHVFQSEPTAQGKEPKVYAIVDCRAVIKEKSGKTVKISDLRNDSDFYRELLANDDLRDEVRVR